MEQTLVERARRGDERAFEALTVSYHARAFAIAFGILRHAERAEEATQRAFLETWRALPRLHDPSSFSGWSTGHLVEACRLEATVIERDDDDEEEGITPWPECSHPFDSIIDRERLARAFSSLAFDERAVLVLRYLAGLSPEDIGLALGLKPRVAQSRLGAAMAALGQAFDPQVAGPPHVTVQPQRA